MKKIFLSFLAILIIVTIGLMSSSCSVSLDQMKIVAEQTGKYSVVAWIAVDGPSDQTKIIVKDVVVLVQSNAAQVAQDKSYTEVLYPIIQNYIDTKVEPQYRDVAKAGGLTILTGIDVLFAQNPKWKANQKDVLTIVDSFCSGALSSLSLSNDDPIIKAAVHSAHLRASIHR